MPSTFVDKVSQIEEDRIDFYPDLKTEISNTLTWSETADKKVNANGTIASGDSYVAQNVALDSATNGLYFQFPLNNYNWISIAFYDENGAFLKYRQTNSTKNEVIFYVPDNASKFSVQAHPTDTSATNPSGQITVYSMK